jgi:hypothetical protein
MNEELQTYMMSFLLSLKEEFAVATYDYTTTSGQYAVSLPPRAIGGKVREIMVKDEDQYRRISRVEPTRVLQPPSNDGTPDRYYFEGNKIIVDPCGAADIRIKYFRRPGALVLEADAGVITAINTGTKTVTLSSLPDGFTTSEEYDFVQSSPPFDTLGMDLAVTGISGNDVTFSATLPTDLVVGDYLCLAGEAPVPQIPVELHSLLAKRTNVVALEALGGAGDPQLKVALTMLADAERRAHFLTDDRDEGAPRYIINRYGPGFRRFHTRFRG